jgi:hypothetical protein
MAKLGDADPAIRLSITIDQLVSLQTAQNADQLIVCSVGLTQTTYRFTGTAEYE